MRTARVTLLALLLTLGAPALAGDLEDGDAAWARGDHPAALIAWSDALNAARAAQDAKAEQALLVRLAGAHRALGRVDLAAEVLGMAAGLANDHRSKADVALGRGLLARHVGDLDTAEARLTEAYRGYRSGEAPKGAANAALNLGSVRLAQGKLTDAEKALETARTLYDTLGDVRGEADVFVDVALLERRRGDLRLARNHLRQARRLYRSVSDDSGVLDCTTNLASVEAALGRPDAAEGLFEEALDLARARKDLRRQGEILHQLGVLAWQGGDASTAVRRLSLAEQAFTEVGREGDALAVALDRIFVEPPDASGFDALIRRASATGDGRLEARVRVRAAMALLPASPAEAGKQARAALRLARRLELSEVRWQALYVQGRLARVDGDRVAAIQALGEAVDVLERRRRLLIDGGEQTFVADHEPVYKALADAYLDGGEPLKALATTERLALSDQPLPQGAAADALGSLAAREAWLEEQVAAEVVERGDSPRAISLREELAALRVEFAHKVDQLRTDVDDLDQRVRIAPEDLEAIQAELPAGVAVLQPVVLEDRLVLLLFRKDRLQAIDVDVDATTIEGTAVRLARALRAGMKDKALLDPLADTLGAWLLTPAMPALDGIDTVVVATTGALRQIPLALLRHDGRYLVQDRAVVTITHVGSLRGAPAPLTLGDDDLLFVGNPDGTLPGAEAEVQALHVAWPEAPMLLGPAATRAAVLEKVQGRTALHLATHGRIDPVEPDRSYLVLAGEEAEGRLGYREIPGLAPWLSNARLVVLSACESGRPVEARGGEGVVSIQGLAAQFRRAGVETLVASLWKVDDQGTRALMDGFYAHLATGDDVATSLRKAQLDLLDDPTNGTPWVWAAFVVAGDWR